MSLLEETPESLMALSSYSEKRWCEHTAGRRLPTSQEEASERDLPCGHLDLRCPAFKSQRNKCLWVQPLTLVFCDCSPSRITHCRFLPADTNHLFQRGVSESEYGRYPPSGTLGIECGKEPRTVRTQTSGLSSACWF